MSVLNTATNLVLRAELQRIVHAVGDEGIPLAVLKGIPLTKRIHDRLDGRSSADNDLLVRRCDVPRSDLALRSLGYCLREGPDLRTALELDFRIAYERKLANVGSIVAELHWGAFPPYLFPVSEDLLWARMQPFDLVGVQTLVFDPAMTIVHLASHFAQHRFGVPSILGDFAQAWNRWEGELDRRDLAGLASEIGLRHVLDFAFLAATEAQLLSGPPWKPTRRARFVKAFLPPSRLARREPSPSYVRPILVGLLAKPSCFLRWLYISTFPATTEIGRRSGTRATRLDRALRPVTMIWRARHRR